MNVNNIAETYTQLGRLGRGALQRQETPDAHVSREQAETPPPALFEPAARAKTASEDAVRLTPAEAWDLTASVTEFILSGQWPVSEGRLHDVSSINLIIPRYV